MAEYEKSGCCSRSEYENIGCCFRAEYENIDVVAGLNMRISDVVAGLNMRISDVVAGLNMRIADVVAGLNMRITCCYRAEYEKLVKHKLDLDLEIEIYRNVIDSELERFKKYVDILQCSSFLYGYFCPYCCKAWKHLMY
jgi:hypothetical protein